MPIYQFIEFPRQWAYRAKVFCKRHQTLISLNQMHGLWRCSRLVSLCKQIFHLRQSWIEIGKNFSHKKDICGNEVIETPSSRRTYEFCLWRSSSRRMSLIIQNRGKSSCKVGWAHPRLPTDEKTPTLYGTIEVFLFCHGNRRAIVFPLERRDRKSVV